LQFFKTVAVGAFLPSNAYRQLMRRFKLCRKWTTICGSHGHMWELNVRLQCWMLYRLLFTSVRQNTEAKSLVMSTEVLVKIFVINLFKIFFINPFKIFFINLFNLITTCIRTWATVTGHSFVIFFNIHDSRYLYNTTGITK